jgi:hypothetical protein
MWTCHTMSKCAAVAGCSELSRSLLRVLVLCARNKFLAGPVQEWARQQSKRAIRAETIIA